MTKADIVNQIAKGTGIEKTEVQQVIDSFMECVIDSLAKEEPVYLRRFGSFIVKRRAEKTARDIAKKMTIVIPEHNAPAFKPAQEFIDKVQG